MANWTRNGPRKNKPNSASQPVEASADSAKQTPFGTRHRRDAHATSCAKRSQSGRPGRLAAAVATGPKGAEQSQFLATGIRRISALLQESYGTFDLPEAAEEQSQSEESLKCKVLSQRIQRSGLQTLHFTLQTWCMYLARGTWRSGFLGQERGWS